VIVLRLDEATGGAIGASGAASVLGMGAK